MPADTDPSGGVELLTPAGLAERLPSRPVLSSPADSARGVLLQRYRHPPGLIDVPGLSDNVLVDHLAGPVLVEDGNAAGGFDRRWTGPGQVSLTPAHRPVRRLLRGRPDVVLVHLAPAMVAAVAAGMSGLDPDRVTLVPRFATPDETADRLVRLLLAEAEAASAGMRLMTETLACALTVHLLRWHSNLAPELPELSASMSSARLGRVVEYMRAHLDEDLPLGRLAEISGLGGSRFARAFRDATGQPPHRYLVGLRVERACELLERTDLPVIEVGLRCGFGQPNHFATVFRTATGLSPRAWRRARWS